MDETKTRIEVYSVLRGKNGKQGAYAMQRVAAGVFEPAKCPDDRVDYCPD